VRTNGSRRPLDGKIVVDATNPLTRDLELALGFDDSAGETVARLAPRARIVKAFNTTGSGNMADSRYGGGKLMMAIAGDDAAAKNVVLALATDLGFEAIDAGPLAMSRNIEPLAGPIKSGGSSPSPGRGKLPSECFGQPIGLHLRLEPGDIVTEDDEVVLHPFAVPDVVAQQGLTSETHALEYGDGAPLVRGHLRHQFFHTEPERDPEYFLNQQPAYAAAARLRGDHNPDLAHVRRPRKRIAYDGRATQHRALPHREQGRKRPALDLLDPRCQDLPLGNVARKKQQVVIRQRLRKGEHCGFVCRSHVANFEIPGFMTDHARIAVHRGRPSFYRLLKRPPLSFTFARLFP
jgi:hypothetical protein